MKLRPVNQFHLNGEFVKKWDSSAQAELEIGIPSTNILKCCKGKRTYAGGFVWRYVEQELNVPLDAYVVNLPLQNEETKEVDFDEGTVKSTKILTYEAQDPDELAKLHKIDTNRYKISNYWSKLRPDGRFTSSVLASLKKLGDNINLKDFKESAKKIITESVIPDIQIKKYNNSNNKAIIFCVADEHIACSNDDSLFENKWDESEYWNRKSKIISKLEYEVSKHGDFEKVIVLNLGDNLDGFNGMTTRGGHHLPQNMSNKQALETYSSINIKLWDALIQRNQNTQFEEYDMENSNHGGMSWDSAANLIIKTYLKTKYPNRVTKTSETKIIGNFRYGLTNIMYTHGKDEKYMKRPYPLNLNDQTESKIKQWMDINGIHYQKGDSNLLIKGDIHKFNWNEGKFFDYINCPSLMGSTDWIMHNFGNSQPGILTLVIDKESNQIESSVIRFNI